jgi:hypothetical protein
MRAILPLTLLLFITACGSDPDERATTGESDLSAKATADVDAAMAEARRATALPVTPPPAAEAAAVEAAGETAAGEDGQ